MEWIKNAYSELRIYLESFYGFCDIILKMKYL